MSDLSVNKLDDSLTGKKVDWIVTGSIAATEVVKAIRALRRLGAEVLVTMTSSAQKFITPQACEWASGNAVVTRYHGFSDHIANNNALVVAPMTASFAAKACAAISDSPALSLFASYAGSGKPIIIHPNMHMSLWDNPFWQHTYAEKFLPTLPKLKLIAPVCAEEKQKFVTPDLLADHISHHINSKDGHAVISLGRTEGKIDAVRYLTNASSGEMGMAIATCLYRRGISTHIVRGPCETNPHCYTSLVNVHHPDEMQHALQDLLHQYPQAALVMAAAVLDFIPAHPTTDKISSAASELTIKCVPVAKIINKLTSPHRVIFKLQTKLDPDIDRQTADSLFKSTSAAFVVINALDNGKGTYHARIYSPRDSKPVLIQSKKQLALRLASHIIQRLQQDKDL